MAEQKCIEMFGILRRLPEITIPYGTLGVSELLDGFHDESIISLFRFVGEELEITHNQFSMGCAALTPQPGKRVIGFVRCDGALWTFSREGLRFEVDAPDVAHKGRNLGDLILSAPQPSPVVLSRHFQPYALV